MLSEMEYPHGLMVAGALLVVAGVVGLALSRNKEDEADPVVLPGDARRGENCDRIRHRGASRSGPQACRGMDPATYQMVSFGIVPMMS